MLYTIIAIIVLVALLVGYGAYKRRKVYQEVDRFENWKISVMNRPITEEISKVKSMTMGGETEEKFEQWRRDWDDIITLHLPTVEEELFEVEEFADKYRFKRAKQILNTVQEQMDSIEARISEMLEDLNIVVESEELNKKNVIPIKERYHELKKLLITKRGEFKEAIGYLESELAKLEQALTNYEEEIGKGNVILGRDLLEQIGEHLARLETLVLDIPKYYKDIRTILPHRVKELEAGVQEMLNDDYVLDHLKIDTFLLELHDHLKVYEEALVSGHFDEVRAGLVTTFEQLEWIYSQLEKEVETRYHLKKEVPSFKHDLSIVSEEIRLMNQETAEIQKGYILDEAHFQTQETLDRVYQDLSKEFEEIDLVFAENKQAFSILNEKVEDMRIHLKELHENAEAYRERLSHLRQDEWAAKEVLQSLKNTLLDSRRLVQKSNLPGVPTTYMDLLEEANELLSEVQDRLSDKPLSMDLIQQALNEAEEQVGLVYDKTSEMVESAILTEKLIQYGNRYRRHYPKLDEELRRSEDYFRTYNYVEAVEIVANAIETVDPNALKQFQVELEQHIS